ncbi:MAG: hypothetical protein JW820_12055, partial [Spirochaetales bacterium]|nr:hypothetical protein [Spirochaetales bacterium]
MMKKPWLVAGLIVLMSAGAWAQTIDFDDYQAAFESFAEGVATTLPATAAVTGLNWSPAYVGEFPHFGVGLSVGAFTMPWDTAVKPVVDMLGVTLPPEYEFMEKYGLPFPAVALDARLGFKPFDVGFKIGFIPEAAREHMGPVNADYFLIGGDLRLPILKDHGYVPALSISAGYTYWRANLGVSDVVETTEEIDLSSDVGSTAIIRVSDPELAFNVETHSIVAKLQASKNLFIFTPHLGIGAAYGFSSAGGGLSSDILYSTDGTNFDPITQSEIDQITAAFEAAGEPVPDLSADGFLVG